MRLFAADAKVDALRKAPLFEGLSRKELEELASSPTTWRYPRARC